MKAFYEVFYGRNNECEVIYVANESLQVLLYQHVLIKQHLFILGVSRENTLSLVSMRGGFSYLQDLPLIVI